MKRPLEGSAMVSASWISRDMFLSSFGTSPSDSPQAQAKNWLQPLAS